MTQNRMGALWDQYLTTAMRAFESSKHKPTPAQIEVWKANFYAGVFSAIIALGKDAPMTPAAYRAWIKMRAEEIRREAEINTAPMYANNGGN